MSYIRNTTNPEALHVYSTDRGVEIVWNDGKLHNVFIEQEPFDELLDRYSSNHTEDVIEVDGITLIQPLQDDSCDLKITLKFPQYLDEELKLWPVTMESIVNEHRRQKFWFSKKNRFNFLMNKLNWYNG